MAYRRHEEDPNEISIDDEASRTLVHTPEEAVPLTSGDDAVVWMPDTSTAGQRDDTQDSSVPSTSNGRAAVPDPRITGMDRSECVGHISTLHDDVEKLFDMPVKFDIASLSSPYAVHDLNRCPSELPQVDTHRYDEQDYGVHRRMSFPHIHQPLRSLSTKSLKNIKPSKVKKKKKKKKAKIRSFPSKGALTSPPIPEEEGEEEDDDDDDDESEDESDEFDEELDENDGEQIIATTHADGHRPSDPNVQVGFFIGDPDGDMPSPTKEKRSFPGDDKSVSSTSSQQFHRTESEDGTTLFSLSDDEPQVSTHAAGAHVPGGMKHGGGGSKSGASRVTFQVGPDSSMASLTNHDDPNLPHANGVVQPGAKKPRKHHHHHEHFRKEHLIMRRQRGSEVHLDKEPALKRSATEVDEAMNLQTADLDNLASHRFEDVRGIRRHKIDRHRGALQAIVHFGKQAKEKTAVKKKVDHTPHEVFVELDRLHSMKDEGLEWEWREKARWIKFEEDVEEGAERWGKPHVASLSFHSLLELRRGLEHGTMLLDLDATDLQSIIHHVVENMSTTDQIRDEDKGRLIRTLLLKHKHVSERSTFLPRNVSYSNLVGLDTSRHYHQRRKSMIQTLSHANFAHLGSNNDLKKSHDDHHNHLSEHESGKLEMINVDVDNNMTDGVHIGISAAEPRRNVQDIMRRIPPGAEASIVLVGNVDFLEKPAVAFVRLAKGQVIDSLTEVPLPTRFVIILLGPESAMDYHEVGRSISTLMANQSFHEIAYRADSREELLQAINSFLDDSIVLPPGDWDQKTLLPIMDMAKKRANIRRRKKKKKQEEMDALLNKEYKEKIPIDPLQRTGSFFGGLINDVRRRYPAYGSDVTDAFNLQCLMALGFIFFACFSPCIAFGGLLSEKTHGLLGVSETVMSTSLCGVLFGLFSGQPLLIVGATGPVLVFEQALYKFCDANNIEFLTFRCWIGLWVFIITAATVAAEGSFLIRYVTRFTEEIFATLISLIFIYEVVKKLNKIYEKHPLTGLDCSEIANLTSNSSDVNATTVYNVSFAGADNTSMWGYSPVNETEHHHDYYHSHKNQPNTALLSTILVLGTFLIAYFLRIFRNSTFLGRSARRALGDFGILIALVLMVLLDYFIKDVYTQKLQIEDGFVPTSPKRKRFLVNPMGDEAPIQVWIIFAAILPAFLIFILLFMEVQLTEIILSKKDRKLRKGGGFHLDQFIMGLLTLLCGVLGLPWMCAATVQTVVHTSALTVFSRTHAPGEKPKLLYVIEQRVTSVVVSFLIGASLFVGSLLRTIPAAVLFGVLLYLGISCLNGVQLFQRIKLLLMPVKYHPEVGFVRRVRTLKMHLFTVIQVGCLVVLWVVKSTQAALAFPFVLLLLIPLRLQVLRRIFSAPELRELDKEEDDSEKEDDDELDFYDQVHMPI